MGLRRMEALGLASPTTSSQLAGLTTGVRSAHVSANIILL